MYSVMKRLIENKYYPTQQEIIDKLNMFMMFNQITMDQYAELMLLAENVYNPPLPPVEEETPEVK